jgi:Protein of unknown function (DUF1573)
LWQLIYIFMKICLPFFIAFFVFGQINAQKQAEIKFDTETIQFGKVSQGEVVDTFFVFKNTGKAPLHVSQAKGSCGCTRPTWPDKPIAPGESAKIGVRFNSAKRSGDQSKTITVESDATRAVIQLRIEGFVVAPEEKVAEMTENDVRSTESKGESSENNSITPEINVAPPPARAHEIESRGVTKVGFTTIKFDDDTFDFGKVEEGATIKHTFSFKNTGDQVFFLSNLRDNCNCLQLIYDETLLVKPGQKGSFEVIFETAGQKGEHTKKILVGGNTEKQEIPVTFSGKVR